MMQSLIEYKVLKSYTTKDGKLIYISAVAKAKEYPYLKDYLSSAIDNFARDLSYEEVMGDILRKKVLEFLKKEGVSVENLEIAVSYRCPVCGASIELTPETVIYVCPYCGWAGDVSGKSRRILVWPSFDYEHILSSLRKVVRRRIRVSEAVLKYIPLWIVDVDAYVYYEGYYKVKRKKGYVTRYGRGEFKEKLLYPVIARLNAEIFADEELKENTVKSWNKLPPLDLDVELGKKIAKQVLAPEIEEGEALKVARDETENLYIERALRELGGRMAIDKKLTEFIADIKTSNPRLVLAPLWIITYSWRGSIYTAAVSGIDGKALRAELPLTLGKRLFYITAAYFTAIFLGGLLELVYRLGNSDDTGKLLLLILAGGVVGTLFFLRNAFKEYELWRR
ncbi:MAG: hypothetical protein DRJ38_09560 [Thermoprotei archaeon]|nr:MAG: hypothetical protein DRJ38_09560 [Thermoprotei archaeon]